MARGKVEEFTMTRQKMSIHFRSLKPRLEDRYQYWTSNPLLQVQLYSAYMCDCIVDIFSLAPDETSIQSPKDGGEILTINVDQSLKHSQ